MRGPDSDPQGQDIAGALMAVDATLAGDPVDPQYAELAELALILRRERPRTSDAFTARLDAQVQRRFARPAPAARGTGLRRWLGGSLAGLTAAAAGVAVVLVVAGGHGGGSSSNSSAAAGNVVSSASASASAAPSAGGAAAGKPLLGITPAIREKRPSGAAAATATSSSSSAASSAPGSVIPGPVIPGKRQVVQSAQLVLGVTPKRIDDVSQQVFNVVGQEKGYVNGSNVTSGGGNGGASFQLSVPSANLAATLTSLSQLRGAHVISRTDNTNDITGQVGGAGQKLAEARALRRSLLKQLADATTTQQVDSIQARLHDANASIASDLSTLRGLQRQVAYSSIDVRIQSAAAPPPVSQHHSGGFTIGTAAHDAGRVLVVVAGVALIVLAAMVPVALVGALLAWVIFAVRRRRRDQALDLV
ncbi:MAG TPA: DUF4349 domain-containing protein [Solirubrobacteraceae bacterium]